MTILPGHKDITLATYEDGQKRPFCLNCGCTEDEMKIYSTCEEYWKATRYVSTERHPEGESKETHFCNDCANVMYCGNKLHHIKLRCGFFEEASWVIKPKSQ